MGRSGQERPHDAVGVGCQVRVLSSQASQSGQQGKSVLHSCSTSLSARNTSWKLTFLPAIQPRGALQSTRNKVSRGLWVIHASPSFRRKPDSTPPFTLRIASCSPGLNNKTDCSELQPTHLPASCRPSAVISAQSWQGWSHIGTWLGSKAWAAWAACTV
ncbi:hypothetical protein BCR34DRAFT_280657 [Clohesyomyces aquaticus]|uniref:Uncharacterized protein n=1 Tax=Clohesyomyces aquaticus TaxID=1231657 RepID=A0A1Y1ZRR4_9PLEO|nr:hypothetical protein BCR34DRAFT_280657 [Clohesyomyces aquaticus]